MKINLLGGTYQARSVIASAQRCLNLYLQRTPLEQGEPAPAIHIPVPGMVALSTPNVAEAIAYFPTSDLECTLIRWRPLGLMETLRPFSVLNAKVVGSRPLVINFNMLSTFTPKLGKEVDENITPLSDVEGAIARIRDLGTWACSPTSQLLATLGAFRAPLSLNVAFTPGSALRANIVPLAEAIAPSSLLFSTLGKTLLPKALSAALFPFSSLRANLVPLTEKIAPTSLVATTISRIRPPKPVTEALMPKSLLATTLHKHGALKEAIVPHSALAATLGRGRRISEALHSTSSLTATAMSSGLNGGVLRPFSAMVTLLGRGLPLHAGLAPHSLVSAAVARKRKLSAALAPHSLLGATLRSSRSNALIGRLTPHSSVGATLTAHSSTYYTALRNWYVATNGNDNSGDGSQGNPWASIQGADNSGKLAPGDVVNVAPGTYLTGGYGLNNGGNYNSLTGYVVYRSTTKGAAIIKSSGGTVFNPIAIYGDYIILDGFTVDGSNAGRSSPITTDYGMQSSGHHTIFLNNTVHDCGGGGLAGLFKDWYTFDGNLVYSCCQFNSNADSGISVYECAHTSYNASPADNSATYHIIMQNNICHDNIETSYIPANKHTDGNGIIIDDLQNTQGFNPNVPINTVYPYNILVQNNTCYNNGGRGVQASQSNNVTILNNTCYNNQLDTTITGTDRGEIRILFANNCIAQNNRATCTSYPNDPWGQYNVAFCDAGGNTGITETGNATYDMRTGQRSYTIDDPTRNAAFPGNNPLGGPLP